MSIHFKNTLISRFKDVFTNFQDTYLAVKSMLKQNKTVHLKLIKIKRTEIKYSFLTFQHVHNQYR